MKKKVILLIVLILLIVGCNHKKFYLENDLYEKSTITEIDLDTFEQLEREKKEFAIFVYLPGCTSCAQFREVLEEFVENNTIEFYAISINDVKNTSIMKKIKYAPSMLLYKDGKVVSYLDATSDKDKNALTNVDSFKKWLEEYIYISK